MRVLNERKSVPSLFQGQEEIEGRWRTVGVKISFVGQTSEGNRPLLADTPGTPLLGSDWVEIWT
jgi:hypothetical protein